MGIRLRPVPRDGGGEHWRWSVYSCPDLALVRDGQVRGGRDEAERAARAAIEALGGTVESLPGRPTASGPRRGRGAG